MSSILAPGFGDSSSPNVETLSCPLQFLFRPVDTNLYISWNLSSLCLWHEGKRGKWLLGDSPCGLTNVLVIHAKCNHKLWPGMSCTLNYISAYGGTSEAMECLLGMRLVLVLYWLCKIIDSNIKGLKVHLYC